MKLNESVIELFIVFVILALVLFPVAIKSFYGLGDDSDHTVTVTNNSKTNIGTKTEIVTTLNNASANSTFALWYDNRLVSSQLQNINTPTAYNTNGGTITINFTAITAGESTINSAYSNTYGMSSNSRAVYSNIVPIGFSVLIMLLVAMFRKGSK